MPVPWSVTTTTNKSCAVIRPFLRTRGGYAALQAYLKFVDQVMIAASLKITSGLTQRRSILAQDILAQDIPSQPDTSARAVGLRPRPRLQLTQVP